MSSVALARNIFDADHDAFRETVRRFAERDVAPHLRDWADAGQVDRDVYRQAGKLGLLGINVEERFAGGGIDDFRFNAIVIEELCRVGAPAVVMGLAGINDLVTPYLASLANEEQKHRFLTPLCTGEKIGAIAMTEPGAGSEIGRASCRERVL